MSERSRVQTELVLFCHLTWLLNKAWAAALANALKGKHKCQSCCCLAKIWLHLWQKQRGRKKKKIIIMWKSSQSSETSQVIVLFLGHTSIFMKLQTQGYRIPCVQMWSQEETDCLCRAYFNARHEGALFKVNCARRCQTKSRKVRDNFSNPRSNRTFTTQWPPTTTHHHRESDLEEGWDFTWRDWYPLS